MEYSSHEYNKISEQAIKKVKNNFDSSIIGQATAKKAIIRKLVALMIRPNNKPLVLMFYGSPGVGKTETAKYLSKALYGSGEILREQMTMVGGENSIKYFKSTSHSEDSFSKHLLNRTSNVILLDEFALAPEFFQTSFFEMFDEGNYSDQNFNVDVSNSIIICTSNLASKQEMEQTINPALLSRFDGFVKFTDFSISDKEKIVDNKYQEFTKSKNMKKKYRDKLNEELILKKLYSKLPELRGVRGINKYLDDCISDYLLEEIIDPE